MRASHKLKLAMLEREGHANFIGYQEDLEGKGFGLYNAVLQGNPLHGSTISAETIVKIGIRRLDSKRVK